MMTYLLMLKTMTPIRYHLKCRPIEILEDAKDNTSYKVSVVVIFVYFYSV